MTEIEWVHLRNFIEHSRMSQEDVMRACKQFLAVPSSGPYVDNDSPGMFEQFELFVEGEDG